MKNSINSIFLTGLFFAYNKRRLSKKLTACLLACLLVVGTLASCGREGPPNQPETVFGSGTEDVEEQTSAEEEQFSPGGISSSGGKQSSSGSLLRNFCADEELEAWFGSLAEDPPVKLEYRVYGMAPFSMEFTDTDLIMQTAEALQTVRIGGVSAEDPDNVSDAGGHGYYFTMADGSEIGFSFIMGTFRWQGDEYHAVTDFGELREMNEILLRIGNPQYIIVYSEDSGFHTRYLETFQTQWVDEGEPWGGLFIYPKGMEDVPFVQITRLENIDSMEPGSYLGGELPEVIGEQAAALGCTVTETGAVEEYNIGTKILPGVLCTLQKEDGSSMQLLVLAMKTKDSLLRRERIVRFCAAYNVGEGTEKEKEEIMTALDMAVKEFRLTHMYYEKKSVQPGNHLLDFCNDDALRDWYEQALQDPPDELTYIEDTWYSITDPDTIIKVLKALDTVKIGDVSTARVGGSGRRIYEFYYESGETQSFAFYVDTFDWGTKSYDVLDWGDLKGIRLR